MLSPRELANFFSLSRIALGLLFILCFQRNRSLLWASAALCVVALTTDLLDGYFARRSGVASIHGRLWDSLGDKAFYIAAIIAFNSHAFMGPLITWGLILREVALYITRILYIDSLPVIERTRLFTDLHGKAMCLTIALGLLRMYTEIEGPAVSVYPYMQVSAYMALAFGVASIVHFFKAR